MAGKTYFVLIALFSAFSLYYQSITGFKGFLDLISWGANIVLLLAGYSYYFKKRIFEAKIWQVLFKLVIGSVILNFIIQILPTSYLGNFSLLNGNLLTNIFVYLLALAFFLPLYLALYKLSLAAKSKKK